MRRELIATIAALSLAACAYAQTREVTDSGVFVADASGRIVRLEGRDGVVVNYLYDAPGTQTSGIAVQVRDHVRLTVRYAGGEIAVAGLPKLASLTDREGRTTAVTADGKPVALLDYSGSGDVAAIALPGDLTWRPSAPDLGMELDSVTWQRSPTGALTTGRDATGHVVAYVVHTDACDVGFSPDGTPRFYDLRLSVIGGHVPAGSDVFVSSAWEGQRAPVPDHLVLTAGGAVGLYVEEPVDRSVRETH